MRGARAKNTIDYGGKIIKTTVPGRITYGSEHNRAIFAKKKKGK